MEMLGSFSVRGYHRATTAPGYHGNTIGRSSMRLEEVALLGSQVKGAVCRTDSAWASGPSA
jgi:hypothetical protein